MTSQEAGVCLEFVWKFKVRGEDKHADREKTLLILQIIFHWMNLVKKV